MIIICPSCKKKFELNESLVPNKGRTLQCGSCNHNWFFKKNDKVEIMTSPIELKEIKTNYKEEILINDDSNFSDDKIDDFTQSKKGNLKFGYILSKIFNYFVVIIITAIGIIILLDTFKDIFVPLIPNLELILYNLFESIKDINLFINDLIS